MGRPALGQAGKTKIISIRVTPAEHKALEAKYGTAAKGLRYILSSALTAQRKEKS